MKIMKLTNNTGYLTILILHFFMSIAFCHSAYSQSSGISGVVKDKKTGEPVSKAEIILKPGNIGTISDVSGNFVFQKLEAGNYEITVYHLGYKKKQKTISLKPGEIKILEINLDKKIRILPVVEIYEAKLENEPYIVNVIDQETIERLAARGAGEILRSEPNVSGIRKGGGNIDPVIRGLKSGQLNVQSNTGQKIEGGCPNRMDPASSHININDISKIEILKGPYSLKYGPNFGSVVNIITKKVGPFESKSFKLNATAIKGWESNWNGTTGYFNVTGGNSKVYFAISGNNQNYGNYKDGNGREVKSSFKKYGYSAELGFKPAPTHEFRANFTESHGRDIWFPALPMDERSDDTRLFSFDYSYKKPESGLYSIDCKVYHSAVSHVMDNKWRSFSDTVVAISSIDALNRGGRADFGIRSGKTQIHLGIDYENISKDGNRIKYLILQPYLPEKKEGLWNDADIQNTGIFAEYKRFRENFNIIAAVRVDFNKANSAPLELKNMTGEVIYFNNNVDSYFTNFSISAGLTYKITRDFSVDFSVGRGVRSPDMVERFIILLPIGYDNFDYLGNPELKPENNHQADLTLNYNNIKTGSFSLNGFFSLITDYITGVEVPPSEVKPQSKGVVGVKKFENTDRVYLYGFEFMYNSPPEQRLGISVSAAMTAGVNPETLKYIIENGKVVGSEKIKNDPLPEIPPLESFLKLNYKFLDNRLIPELRIRLTAPQNRISESYYEKKTPGFFLASFNVEYRFIKILTIAGGIRNILNNAYYEHLNRRVIGSDMPLYEPGRIFYLNLILNI